MVKEMRETEYDKKAQKAVLDVHKGQWMYK